MINLLHVANVSINYVVFCDLRVLRIPILSNTDCIGFTEMCYFCNQKFRVERMFHKSFKQRLKIRNSVWMVFGTKFSAPFLPSIFVETSGKLGKSAMKFTSVFIRNQLGSFRCNSINNECSEYLLHFARAQYSTATVCNSIQYERRTYATRARRWIHFKDTRIINTNF